MKVVTVYGALSLAGSALQRPFQTAEPVISGCCCVSALRHYPKPNHNFFKKNLGEEARAILRRAFKSHQSKCRMYWL